jgi:hypothetical protein
MEENLPFLKDSFCFSYHFHGPAAILLPQLFSTNIL